MGWCRTASHSEWKTERTPSRQNTSVLVHQEQDASLLKLVLIFNMNLSCFEEIIVRSHVFWHRSTGLVHLYTIESNYNCARVLNYTQPATGEGQVLTTPPSREIQPKRFTEDILQSVGRALVVTIMDLIGCNPWSRLPNTEFRSIEGVRKWALEFAKVWIGLLFMRTWFLEALIRMCMYCSQIICHHHISVSNQIFLRFGQAGASEENHIRGTKKR